MAKTSVPLLRSGHTLIQKTSLWGEPAGTLRLLDSVLPSTTDGCRIFIVWTDQGLKGLSQGSLLKHFRLPPRQSLPR